MKRMTALLLILFVAAPTTADLAMTADEREVWNVLVEQIRLAASDDWDRSTSYMHSEFVQWGDDLPVPHPRSPELQEIYKLVDGGIEFLSHEMLPLTVHVEGDTAIINAILRAAVRSTPGASPSVLNVRIHNTWIRTDDGWRLLSNYNTFVE